MYKYFVFITLLVLMLVGCTPTNDDTKQREQTDLEQFTAYVDDAAQLFQTNVELGITEEADVVTLEDISYETKDGLVTKVTKQIEPLPLHVLTQYDVANNTYALDERYTLSWSTTNNTITSLHVTRNSETLKQHVYAMPLKQRVGHLIVTGFEGTSVTPALQEAVEQHFLSNVILFSKNITSHAQLLQLSEQFHALEHADPLWLSIDEEGGNVSRLPDELATIPTAAELASRYSVDTVQQIAEQIGKALRHYGIQVDYAPVLDVNSNTQNPVIGTRSFSSDPEVVANYALAFHRGLSAASIVSAGKHFPGHGDTNVDSHLALPVIKKTIDELNSVELVPFRRAISENVPMLMIGHLLVSAMDGAQPASISKAVITDFLRTELAYNGIVVTDDVTMEALDLPISTIAVQTIQAGSDLVLIGHGLDKALEAQQAIIEAVERGDLSEQRVNRSVMRILSEKRKHGEATVTHFSVQQWNDELTQLLKQ
ncbi:MAG: beta-N-acetylhexosaminidase [Caryophanon sp.]|nr:beta-N-acetylhexosaminidase [Caryophanon sp.]